MRSPRVLAVLFVVAILVSGCAAKGSPQDASSVEEQGITQAEAQVMWDGLAAAFGKDYDPNKALRGQFDDRRSQIETAVLAALDLKSVMDKAWSDDINSRVLAINPDVMKGNTGDGEFADYMEADKARRESVISALDKATTADIFHDAWLVWNAGGEGEDDTNDDAPSIPNLPYHRFNVLHDALLNPALASKRVVAVEGTGTVLVTFKARMTFSPDQPYDADWTNRYTVEKRDGRWVITGITNLGDYAVAVTESDLKRAKEAAEKAKIRPTDAEVAEAFNTHSPDEIVWMGQDHRGLWWVVSTATTEMTINDYTRVETFSEIGYRDTNGLWHRNGGANGGAAQVDDQFPVPNEVIAAMEKAGVRVNDIR